MIPEQFTEAELAALVSNDDPPNWRRAARKIETYLERTGYREHERARQRAILEHEQRLLAAKIRAVSEILMDSSLTPEGKNRALVELQR